jgi:hypothetical protein
MKQVLPFHTASSASISWYNYFHKFHHRFELHPQHFDTLQTRRYPPRVDTKNILDHTKIQFFSHVEIENWKMTVISSKLLNYTI